MSNLTTYQEFINDWLILFLNKKNGYVLLIFSLCFSEIIYNCGFILSFYHHDLICHIRYSLFFIGGLAVSMWINIICGIVLYILYTLKTFDIYKYYPYFIIYAWIIPILTALFNFNSEFNWHCGDEMNDVSYGIGITYSYTRLILVLINVIIYIFIYYKVKNITNGDCMTNRAVVNVATRMKYYALIHILFRILPTYTDIIQPNSYYILVYISSILTPSTGIGYFIIFLYMHPGAFQLYASYFRCILFIELDYRKSWVHSNHHSVASGANGANGGFGSGSSGVKNRYLAVAQMNESLLNMNNNSNGNGDGNGRGSSSSSSSNSNNHATDNNNSGTNNNNKDDVMDNSNNSNNSTNLSIIIDSQLENSYSMNINTTANTNIGLHCDDNSDNSSIEKSNIENDDLDWKSNQSQSQSQSYLLDLEEGNLSIVTKDFLNSNDENQLQTLYEQDVEYHYIIEWDLIPICCLDWLCCHCGNNGKNHTPYFEYHTDSDEDEEDDDDGYYIDR